MNTDFSKVKSVLFVCTGNTCRSPMAEGLFKFLTKDKFETASAGLMSVDGFGAAADAIDVMKEFNIDISGHKSQALTLDMINHFDLIVVMEQRQKYKILEMAPFAADKIFLLTEFNGDKEHEDIFDPIGFSREYYKKCFEMINKHVFSLIDILLKY